MEHPNEIFIGIRVQITNLESTDGFFIKPEHLEVREIGITGEVIGYVPGHGGDVWWVRQENGAVGAYMFTEFEADTAGYSEIRKQALAQLDELPLSKRQKALMKRGVLQMSEEELIKNMRSLDNALNSASVALAAAEAILKK